MCVCVCVMLSRSVLPNLPTLTISRSDMLTVTKKEREMEREEEKAPGRAASRQIEARENVETERANRCGRASG